MRKLAFILPLVLVALSGSVRPAARPNVILISIDTLRADRLSCYGYRLRLSPNIDRLLTRGARFTDAITNVPLTGPSFTSLFTSRYPHETGAIRNGIPMVSGLATLAAILKKNGYQTAAIISNWPLQARLSNLDLGFDSYDDDFHQKRWLLFNDERDAEAVTVRALAWLEKAPKEPFFAWIHYSDPHSPYLRHEGFTFSRTESDSARYDSEVAYTDHHLGVLLNRLEAKGLLERSLVVFISDHGESLGEHGYTGHGRNLYQPSLRVPFGLVGPGIPVKKEAAPIQLLDLAPTVLAYAGIPAPKSMRGLNLLPALRGEAPWPERVLLCETYPGAAPQVQGAERMLTKPLWVGRKQGERKLLFNVTLQRWELYDLASDPDELDNLVKLRDPEFVRESDQLLAWYREWEKKMVVGEIGVLTEEDRRKFKALGYVDGP
jgi:arylsulfatase A-like enzyme